MDKNLYLVEVNLAFYVYSRTKEDAEQISLDLLVNNSEVRREAFWSTEKLNHYSIFYDLDLWEGIPPYTYPGEVSPSLEDIRKELEKEALRGQQLDMFLDGE